MTTMRQQAWKKYDSMNEDGPNGSLYETLAKHDQSETKCDTHKLGVCDLVGRSRLGPV